MRTDMICSNGFFLDRMYAYPRRRRHAAGSGASQGSSLSEFGGSFLERLYPWAYDRFRQRLPATPLLQPYRSAFWMSVEIVGDGLQAVQGLPSELQGTPAPLALPTIKSAQCSSFLRRRRRSSESQMCFAPVTPFLASLWLQALGTSSSFGPGPGSLPECTLAWRHRIEWPRMADSASSLKSSLL